MAFPAKAQNGFMILFLLGVCVGMVVVALGQAIAEWLVGR